MPQLVEIASAYRRGARLSKAYSSISISHGEEGHPGGAVLERAAQLKLNLSGQTKFSLNYGSILSKESLNRVKACSRDISEKYLNPPTTTDFGILFLPIEGLFAEVIRRTGLIDAIQRDYRVVIAGPTTLWSNLNSLQMGFRTLAIQKRSSEVWNLLAAVKTEWTKYGEVLGAVQKKLHQASDAIERAKVRSNAIGRKLRGVQELPAEDAAALLPADLKENRADVHNGGDGSFTVVRLPAEIPSAN